MLDTVEDGGPRSESAGRHMDRGGIETWSSACHHEQRGTTELLCERVPHPSRSLRPLAGLDVTGSEVTLLIAYRNGRSVPDGGA